MGEGDIDTGVEPGLGAPGPAAAIDAWRACGADRVAPVRFRFIEALARRAAAHQGDARRLLDDKLAGLVAAYAAAVKQAPPAAPHLGADRAGQPAAPSGLADLVKQLAPPAALAEAGSVAPAAHGARPAVPAPPELKALSYFRSTWSKLNTEQRLSQSLARLPGNAGPLNSHHLVHRSLTLMRDLSPAYLDKFMSYVDALLWLEQANGGGASIGKDTPRG